MRPAEVCRYLLLALNPTEGRRQQRKRDTTPDAIGIAVKRELLERAMSDNPAPEHFAEWMLQQCQAAGAASGPWHAMAQEILNEWRLAETSTAFRTWLQHGAPSDDAN
jgi:hypothetical protein